RLIPAASRWIITVIRDAPLSSTGQLREICFAGDDATQAGEILDAEVAPRVRDQSLISQTHQLGADHGACRADQLRKVLVRQPEIHRVAVAAALALEADQVAEGAGHPRSNRRLELPEQPPFEELRAGRRR